MGLTHSFPPRRSSDLDDVAVAFGGVVAQRVLAQLAVGHAHFHVRAGREGRQLAAAGVAQLERTNAVGGVDDAGDAQRHQGVLAWCGRSEEHTSELQSLMRISYAVFCLKNKNNT